MYSFRGLDCWLEKLLLADLMPRLQRKRTSQRAVPLLLQVLDVKRDSFLHIRFRFFLWGYLLPHMPKRSGGTLRSLYRSFSLR